MIVGKFQYTWINGVYKPTDLSVKRGEIMRSWLVQTTEKFIVKDGKSEYRILIPQNSKEEEFISFAALELQTLFLEATGVALEIVDDSVSLDKGKFLSVGDTALARTYNVTATEETLTKGGYILKTAGEHVFMLGANTEASMYAVYAFLAHAFDFEQFFTKFYRLKKGVTTLPLYAYDITDIPDFEYRIQGAGFIRWNKQNLRRMRWTDSGDGNMRLFIPAVPNQKDTIWHNSLTYLPPEEYKAQYPEWYSEPWTEEVSHGAGSRNQLCYTARGNKEKYALMVETLAKRIEALFAMEQYKNHDWITVSIHDNQNGCTCPTCKAEKAKYGADSAVIVKFLNDVAKTIEAWMQTDEGKPYYRKNFRIFFFAYHATNASPTRYDRATDTYVPIDESVICNEHVVPYFAETNGDYLQNLHDTGTANTPVGRNMRGWSALSKEVYFWSYSTNFWYFFVPYNSFDVLQDTLKFAKNCNTKFVMIQDQWIQENTQTAWGIFKNWLHAKLLWDIHADVEKLKKEFFDEYFMEASATMLQVFDTWRVWARYQRDVLGMKGFRSVYFDILQKHLWPKDKVLDWILLIERAEAEIAVHKETDERLYTELKRHIRTESIAYRFILLELYKDDYSPEQLQKMRQEFIWDTEWLGLRLMRTMRRKHTDELAKEWNVSLTKD